MKLIRRFIGCLVVSGLSFADISTVQVLVLSKYHPQQVTIQTRSRIFNFEPAQINSFSFSAEQEDDIGITVNGKETRIYRGEINLSWEDNEYRIINTTSMETYVAGVVVGEIGANPPSELVKAQAILARTYARKVSNRELLSDLAYHQVFNGFDHHAAKLYSQTSSSAALYLWQGRDLADALFHAQCGSAIYSPGQFWQSGNVFIARSLPEEMTLGDLWSTGLSFNQLRETFNASGPLQRLDGHPETIRIASQRFGVEQFRLSINRRFGWNTLPSNEFAVEPIGEGYRFTGRGHGHLVGLCQQQASQLAKKGWNAQQMLAIFYPGTVVR